uniref:Splicing factor U2AF subunit n=1 Tax=Nannochloropsis gaditana (strain CCMP526) TaxID=1093141 RepID=I2CP62_NANGC
MLMAAAMGGAGGGAGAGSMRSTNASHLMGGALSIQTTANGGLFGTINGMQVMLPTLGGGPSSGLPSLPQTAVTGAVPMYGDTQQSTRHARRVYVGGNFGDASDFEVLAFFNQIINESLERPSPAGPVVAIQVNRQKHFAFLELNSVPLTTSVIMQLDGVPFRGNPLKVKRPTDYHPELLPLDTPPPPTLKVANFRALQASGALPMASTGLTAPGANSVPDSPYKIFVGGLPYHVTDDQVRELLSAFGPLRGFDLKKDPATGMSKGYGFCEYIDHAVGDVAIQGLHGMDLGGKTLTVKYALASQQLQQQQSMQQMLLSTTPATKVLVLANMVTPDELKDDQEYQEIVEDVREEVAKFGEVLSLVIPRPEEPSAPPSPAVGKIFVEYAESSQTKAAAQSLQGRRFAGRIVQASFYDEEKFKRQELA